MEKTLLYEAFSKLSSPELREFGKFVRSPFFNTNPNVVALCDYLAHCRKKGEPPEAVKAWAAIHPAPAGERMPVVNSPLPMRDEPAKRPLSPMAGTTTPPELEKMPGAKSHHPVEVGPGVGLRLTTSALLALLEKYWIYREKFEDPGRTKIRLAAAYRKRGLDKHFKIALREARQSRENLPWRHADYYHDLNLLEWEQYQFTAATQRTVPLNLQEVSDYMDTAFISRKLRLACAALSHQVVYKTEYKIGMLDAVLASVAGTALEKIPVVGLYYHCCRFLRNDNPAEHFEQFRTMLLASADQFPLDELRSFYLLAFNFGIKKINESAEGWLGTTLDLYKSALERDLLLENGLISRFAFNNIVAIALRTGELDWTEAFIHRYKPRLERQWRETTAGLNLARVAYARRDYRTALLNLQRSDYKDLINNLIAKTLQLKIYYETAEYNLLDSHLSSMQNFIRRHTAIGHHRTNYGRIVHYTRQLMSLNFKDQAAMSAFRRQVEAEEILTEKDWFLEMLVT